MKAIILAAGMASRLRPLTDHKPKCLLEIGKQCLLGRAIEGLIFNGIREVVIVTGYLQEQIIEFVQGHYPDLKVEYIYNEKYASTNNIYSLWLTKDKIRGERILLLDSDILFDPLLVKAVLDCPDTTCLALNDHPLSEEEIKVIPDAQGKVAEISKTCSIGKAIGDELDRMILQENQVNIFYEAAFERLIAQGHTFGIVDTTPFFSMELDTVADFQQAIDKIPAHLL